jgi:hypothetical protein
MSNHDLGERYGMLREMRVCPSSTAARRRAVTVGSLPPVARSVFASRPGSVTVARGRRRPPHPAAGYRARMPGPRTYQAIGFATYQGGRIYARRRRAELQRQAAVAGGATLALLVVSAAVLAAARQRSGHLPGV